jgi:hypothetical protein
MPTNKIEKAFNNFYTNMLHSLLISSKINITDRETNKKVFIDLFNVHVFVL